MKEQEDKSEVERINIVKGHKDFENMVNYGMPTRTVSINYYMVMELDALSVEVGTATNKGGLLKCRARSACRALARAGSADACEFACNCCLHSGVVDIKKRRVVV